jgi:hypothetical protein
MSALEIVKNVQNNSSNASAWRRTRARCAMVGALVGGATSFGGCGSVAGPEYTGEVGLELRGEVVALDEGQEDLVPVLAFIGPEGLYFVEGEISGRFPQQFTMRVDEPPPDEALTFGGHTWPGAPAKVGVAFLALADRGHGRTLPNTAGPVPTHEQSEPDPDTGEFTRVETECSEDGERCLTSTYSCQTEACATVLQQTRATSEGGPWIAMSGFDCSVHPCLTYTQNCDDQSCSRNVQVCEPQSKYDRISTDGTIDRCSLLATEGKAPGNGGLGDNFAQDLLVVFASEKGRMQDVELEPGYNVIRVLPGTDISVRVQALTCELDAESEVANTPGDDSDAEQEARVAELRAECPDATRLERLTNPSAHELRITLGASGAIF